MKITQLFKTIKRGFYHFKYDEMPMLGIGLLLLIAYFLFVAKAELVPSWIALSGFVFSTGLFLLFPRLFPKEK